MTNVRMLFEEIAISVDAALASAETVAQTDIVESQAFNALVNYLNDAAGALATLTAVQDFEKRIFATPDAARFAIADAPVLDGIGYAIARDGIGRAAVRLVWSG
jgi:hypothetical protein